MPQAPVYNMQGQATGEVELDARIFGVKPNSALVHQAVIAQQSNSRVAIAHTKTRGEVRGGGKKPWKQKGTGRARHGSIRSPLWIGGGVTFGPRSSRNYTLRLNAKARQRALFMVLSDKLASGKLKILEALQLTEIKTKTLAQALKALKLNRQTLLIVPKQEPTIWKSSRNIATLTTAPADSLNVVDILSSDSLLLTQPALDVIKRHYKK